MTRRALLPLLLAALALPAWAQSPPSDSGPWGPPVLTVEKVTEELKRADETPVPADLAEADRAAFAADLARRKTILDELRATLGKIAAVPGTTQLEQWAAETGAAIRTFEAAGETDVPEWLTESQLEAHERELADLVAQRERADGALKKAKADLAENPRRAEELKLASTALAERLAGADSFPAGSLGTFLRETVRIELRLTAEKLAYEQKLRLVGTRWNEVRELRLKALAEQVERKEQFVGKARAVPIRQFQRELEIWRKSIARDEEEIAGLRSRLAGADLAPAEVSRLRLQVFEREMSVRLARTRASTLKAKLFRLETARPLKDDQEKRNRFLEEGRDRLVTRFGKEERHGTPARTTELLTANLQRVKEQRAALNDVYQPQVTGLLAEQIGARGGIFDELWPLETVTGEEPDDLVRLLKPLDTDLKEEARTAWRQWADRQKQALTEELEEVEQSITLLLAVDDDLLPKRRLLLDEIEDFIIRRIYWVRSDEPLGVKTALGVPLEIAGLAKTYTRPALINRLVQGYREGKWRFVATAAAFVAVLALGVYLIRRLRPWGDRFKYRGGAILALVQRVAVTLALSSLAAICLSAAALLLGVLDLPPEFAAPGRRLLFGLAVILVARRALWMLFKDQGLAMEEMGATRPVAEQLRKFSRFATGGALFLGLPFWVVSAEPLGLVHIPRLIYSTMLLFFVLLLAWVIRPRGALVRALTGGGGVFYQVWFFLSPFVILGLLAIVGMDVLGYRFGARLLIGNVVETFVGVLAIVGLYNLVTRVVRQTAARVRARSYREGADAAARARSEQTLEQVTRLVTVSAIVVAVLLFARFWGLGRGLTSFFGSIHLYTIDAAAGTHLTLWDALAALAWIGAGHFIVLHLPGVFEMLVFSRLERVTAGTRYAVCTITKYLVLLVSYSAAVLALHLSFQSLGYVVAALSVGIGFGLQEIVSNFVSGLILFFERPIRVGDTVTVGGIEGTVERINIRSTELLNGDRQVIIIPNRKFISEEVVNWTHNDQIIRSTISVGVAYGTDLAKVGRVLLEILRAHPRVLDVPPPQVHLVNFGESSLDFVARPFTLVEYRTAVLNDLNLEIARRFAAEGIEIPFPQRDVRLRSNPPAPIAPPPP